MVIEVRDNAKWGKLVRDRQDKENWKLHQWSLRCEIKQDGAS